ncbi:MAG: hypothetical protein WC964_04295 [Acholeplasmataceae bacterium]
MTRNLLSILTLLICFTLLGCGSSSNFTNENYQPSFDEITLGIIPVVNEMQSFSDSAFTIVYSDSLNRYSTYPIENIHKSIENSKRFVEIVNKLVLKEYSSEELENTPNLQSTLDPDELELLKKNLDGSNLLLLPITFNVDSKLYHTFGFARFRLYDLESGMLIYDVSDDFNVNLDGERGKRHMTFLLVAHSYSFFEKNILKNS